MTHARLVGLTAIALAVVGTPARAQVSAYDFAGTYTMVHVPRPFASRTMLVKTAYGERFS